MGPRVTSPTPLHESEVEKLARDIEDHICHGQDIIATRVAWPWLVGILRPVLEAKDAEIARRIEPERAEQAWEAAHERLKAERDAAQQALREAQEEIERLGRQVGAWRGRTLTAEAAENEAVREREKLSELVHLLKAGAPVIRCCEHCEMCAAERDAALPSPRSAEPMSEMAITEIRSCPPGVHPISQCGSVISRPVQDSVDPSTRKA